MNKLTLLLGLLISAYSSIGQSQDTTYLDTKFKKTTKENAEYFSYKNPYPENESLYFEIIHYMSGGLKSYTGHSYKFPNFKKGFFASFLENGYKETEGQYDGSKKGKVGIWMRWHPNGQQLDSGGYLSGEKTGTWKNWYDNGKIMEVANYLPEKKPEPATHLKVVHEFYSYDGNQTVKEGNGSALYYHIDTRVISSIGKYKNGYKSGEWKGFYKNGKPEYIEIYKNGKLSGTSWDKNGKEFNYTALKNPPTPKGGLKTFYNYIANVMEYPTEARKNNIQGKVYIKFIIDKNGEITEAKTIKGIGYGCNEEAEAAVMEAPKWMPRKARGIPAKSEMVLPVAFKFKK